MSLTQCECISECVSVCLFVFLMGSIVIYWCVIGRPGSSAIDSSVSQHCPTQSINVHLKGERNIVSLPESHVVPQQADSSFITEESHFLLGLIVSVDIAVDIT